MDFDTAIGQAWNDHADDAQGVADRVPELLALVIDEPQLERLIALARHVCGPHLGAWSAGRVVLESLRTHATFS